MWDTLGRGEVLAVFDGETRRKETTWKIRPYMARYYQNLQEVLRRPLVLVCL